MTYIVNEQWYELFGKLIWAVVVRAVRHKCWHAVSIMIGAHEVVARRFRCRVWRVRIVFRGLDKKLGAVSYIVLARCLGGKGSRYALGMCELECAVDLICGNVVEELAFIFFGQRLPVFLGGLQQR